LTVGASVIYTHESGISLEKLQDDINHLKHRYIKEDEAGIANEGRLVIRADAAGHKAPEVYDTNTISGIMMNEAHGIFDSRTAILGHLQQGRIPSPLDRIRATRLATSCINFLLDTCAGLKNQPNEMGIRIYTNDPAHFCLIGVKGSESIILLNVVAFTPVDQLFAQTDLKYRRPKNQWWTHLSELHRTLAKR
jgi:Phosphofructokinase